MSNMSLLTVVRNQIVSSDPVQAEADKERAKKRAARMARRMMNKVKALEDVPEVNDDDKMIGFDE